MRVFIAGGSGTIGVPLVRQLVAAGHEVIALTRTREKESMLRSLGATPAVADALDAEALRRVLVAARPTHVIHQLTALPKFAPRKASELEPTNRLRIEGTRNLVDASVAAGAKRIVAGSFALFQAERGDEPAGVRGAIEAVKSMENQILEANRRGLIEGVVLRYGLFYGAETPGTQEMLRLVKRRLLPVVRGDRSLLPCIHIEDAARATVVALDRAPAGAVYDIVDDQPVSMTEIANGLADAVGARRPIAVPSWLPKLMSPYVAYVTSMQLPLSNAKARAELGWRPSYPTYRDGLAELMPRAA